MAGGTHKRKLLLALVFVGTALALPVACMNADDADDADVASKWSAVTDSGCLEKDADNRYKIPRCANQCSKKAYQYEFWYSAYNVNGTLGKGEHQGIATAIQYAKVDPRPDDGSGTFEDCKQGGKFIGGPSCPDGAKHRFRTFNGAVGTPGDAHTINPSGKIAGLGDNDYSRTDMEPTAFQTGEPTYTLCEEDWTQIRRISDHGRTINPIMDKSHRRKVLKVPDEDAKFASDELVWNGTFWHDHDNVDYETDPTKMPPRRECIEKLDDGFMDSVCGNCSYVLPNDACGSRHGGFGEVGTWEPTGNEMTACLLNGTTVPTTYTSSMQCVFSVNPIPPNNVTYGTQWKVADWRFTHCGDDSYGKHGTLCMSTSLGSNWPGYSGKWGHNSNTDADAAYDGFRTCDNIKPDNYQNNVKVAKAICDDKDRTTGVKRGKNTKTFPGQDPCGDRTNSAGAKWIRSDGTGWFTGSTNIDETPPNVTESLPAPTCNCANGCTMVHPGGATASTIVPGSGQLVSGM